MKTLLLPLMALVLSAGAFAASLNGVVIGPAHGTTLDADIRANLRNDPGTRNLDITVDTYKGLAVLHGWVRTPQIRRDVASRVRNMPGVDRVYSYIVVDVARDSFVRDLNEGLRANVTQSNMNERPDVRVPTIGLISAPNDLARNAKVRLAADAVTGEFDIAVDSYDGLVVLHGKVPDDSAKDSVDAVASRTPGVDRVFSYLNVGDAVVVPEPTTGTVVIDLGRPEIEKRETVPAKAVTKTRKP